MKQERRRGNQANPQDKCNYLIIVGFFLTLWLMLLKAWSDSQFTVVVGFVGTILGALGGFLTGRMHAQQQTDTAVNTGSVENMTVKTDQQPQSDYADDRKTKELSPELLREIQGRR
jgi:hypothetical protein